jgi:hypothetical protein
MAVAKVKSTAAAETRCKSDLISMMRGNPSDPIPKAQLKRRFSDVSDRAFNRAFNNAVKEWEARHVVCIRALASRRRKAANICACINQEFW